MMTDFHCVVWLLRRVFHFGAMASRWLVWWRILRLFCKLPGGVCKLAWGLPGVLLYSSNTNESSFMGIDGGLCKIIGKGLGVRGLGSAVVTMAQPMPVVVDLVDCAV